MCHTFFKDQDLLLSKVEVFYSLGGSKHDSSIWGLHILNDEKLSNVPKWKHGKIHTTIIELKEHAHVFVDIWFQFTNSNVKHLFFKIQFQISTCNLVLPLLH